MKYVNKEQLIESITVLRNTVKDIEDSVKGSSIYSAVELTAGYRSYLSELEQQLAEWDKK